MTRFDRDYYVNKHLPLVMKAWGSYGLVNSAAFFPDGDGAGVIAVCLCHFPSEQALDEALASPGTPGVMADVSVFTDATPVQGRVVEF